MIAEIAKAARPRRRFPAKHFGPLGFCLENKELAQTLGADEHELERLALAKMHRGTDYMVRPDRSLVWLEAGVSKAAFYAVLVGIKTPVNHQFNPIKKEQNANRNR